MTFDPAGEPDHVGGSIPVTQEEFNRMIYTPKEGEWPDVGRDAECERIAHGLGAIMTLSIAEHFLAPVDLNAFPAYAMVIEYPVDLSTIKERIENKYYRSVEAVIWGHTHVCKGRNNSCFPKELDLRHWRPIYLLPLIVILHSNLNITVSY